MNNLALISIALLLVCSVFAEEKSHHEANGIKGDEPKYTITDDGDSDGFGFGGGSDGGKTGGGPGGYSVGFDHGGVYGGGKLCKLGCCSESYKYSLHPGGGYYGCTCCATPFDAQVYKIRQHQHKAAAANPKN